MFSNIKKELQYWQFSKRQQQVFLEDLLSLIEDGVPANQAAEIIRDMTDGAIHKVANNVIMQIGKGKPFADGLQNWFSNSIVEIIRAGESSGTLNASIKAATNLCLQQNNALRVWLNALLYPCIVICLALIMVVFVKNYVLTTFLTIAPIARWPQAGSSLFYFADALQHWWWFFLLLFVIFAITIAHMLKNLTGNTRKWIDDLPLLSLYRDTHAARFMETLGLLISNGVILKQALSIMHRNAAPYLSWHLLNMEYRLSGGKENIADVLDTSLIRKQDLMRLRVVAKGKNFEKALISLAQRTHARNARTIALAGKVLGAILLALSAMLAIAIVVGIYSIGSTLAT